MPAQLPGGMTPEQYWASQAAARQNTTGVNLRSSDGSHFDAQNTYSALMNADPRNYSSLGPGNPGAFTQSDLERSAEQSGQWYGSPADTRYAGNYYSANPRDRIEIQTAAEQARTTSLENARKAFAGLNPDGTPMVSQPQAYVQPHAGASLGYDDLYASNKTAYDRPGDGTMNAMSYGPGQQPTSRQQMVDQRNAAGRANVLQRFANANQKLQAMGATANMPRINDVGYGGSPRGMLPPNKQGQGGINNTALMGQGAQPTFRYGVSQNISMPAGSSPGTQGGNRMWTYGGQTGGGKRVQPDHRGGMGGFLDAGGNIMPGTQGGMGGMPYGGGQVGYGGSSRPVQGQFGGFQGGQAGGKAPPGMYTQGWQSQQPLPQGMGAGSPGMPGASGGMSGRPVMGQFGNRQPRLANPSGPGISPYVR